RAIRHKIRSTLTRLGFGNAGQGGGVAPAANFHEAKVALRRRGLNHNVDAFVGRYTDGDQLSVKIQSWWDISELNSQFDAFLSTYQSNVQSWEQNFDVAPGTERDAFRAYVPMLTMWRELPYRVPPLPAELVPKDWNEPLARAIFTRGHQ